MSSSIVIRFPTNEVQKASLIRLRTAFAEACNTLAPLVREHRCWNRVALHHLAYRQMRERFPALGSQMVCNAIYSVSRTARVIYQHTGSPWCISQAPMRALPLLVFSDTAPVYFDRHTLSLRQGGLSMYTLDGRILFEMPLPPEIGQRFHNEKVREITLSEDSAGFFLIFAFGIAAESTEEALTLPEYALVISTEQAIA